MSIIVTMENASKEFEENTQDLLDHLSIVYVATEKSETSDDSAVNMYILHSGASLIWIQDVHHVSPRAALSLQFTPVLLPTSATNFTKIASFTCKAPACDGGIREGVKRTSTPALTACLSSPVVHGYFRMDASAAQFLLEAPENTSGVWSVWCLNHLDRGIIVNDVSVSKETKHMLKVLNFTGPSFLPPGCWNVFSLKLAVKSIAINLFTNVFLTTNIGAVFAIPLQIYSAQTKEGSLGSEVIAHCGMHYFMGKPAAENPHWDQSLSLDRSTWGVDAERADKLYASWKRHRSGDVCKRAVLGTTRLGLLKRSRQPEPFAVFLPRLLAEPGLVLNFSATALRNSLVKYFVVRNPSSLPVSLQLLPLSAYPEPGAAVHLLHRWFGTDMQTINLTTREFQLTRACPHPGVHSQESRLGALHLRLKPLEQKRVGVVFTPADYGRVTSLILIRNNLTVLDMVAVEGFGARELLRVGGQLPGTGGSLRFKVPESTLMECQRQLKDSKQILSVTKNFKVENIGPLPITVSSLKINGYNCQGYGFEVRDCHPFSLDPNTSRDISIVFTPDFTSSWVVRELTLVSAARLEFHFTLNVTLPHHLLPVCADVVPGPSWEESFWRLTVVLVSVSLLGVIAVAFQQAQHILVEFVKARQRQHAGPSSPPGSGAVDVISSHSHKSSCKSFLDAYGPPDKGRGKSCLPVSPHRPGGQEDSCTDVPGDSWISLKYPDGGDGSLQESLAVPQNALSRDEGAPGHAVGALAPPSGWELGERAPAWMFPKETDVRTAELCALKTSKKLPENQALRYTPQDPPDLPETSRKNHGRDLTRFFDSCHHPLAPGLGASQIVPVGYDQTGVLTEQRLLTEAPPAQGDCRNSQQVPVKSEGDDGETSKKGDTKSSSEKKTHKAPKEDACSDKQDVPSVEVDLPNGPHPEVCAETRAYDYTLGRGKLQAVEGVGTADGFAGLICGPAENSTPRGGWGPCSLVCWEKVQHVAQGPSVRGTHLHLRGHQSLTQIYPHPMRLLPWASVPGLALSSKLSQEDPYRKKKLPGKKEGHLQNLNWNKNRTCKKNKKRGVAQVSRSPEQSELRLVCSDLERAELSGDVHARTWCVQEGSGQVCEGDARTASNVPAVQRGAERPCRKPGHKCADKFCSDSSSDCGSSSGSVRASRGRWGSWSSSSSSEGDKKPAGDPGRFPLAGMRLVSPRSQSRPVPAFQPGPQVTERTKVAVCPIVAGLAGEPRPPGVLEGSCLTCVMKALLGDLPCLSSSSAAVERSSFIDWGAACEGQLPSVYCPLELNDYDAFPEENMNYANGFPCPAEVPTDFLEHHSQSAWSAPPSVPAAWGHAGFVGSPPYLTSTRSLSPMSGLFGSIWAPQSDVYEACCPLSPAVEHPGHMESQAVMCKEYYPGFDPFRAYMNLDIWTSTANRSAGFPLPRDPGYCGNV
ncbi:transmembrane protein 131-like [Tupaia chinensis]|uniref:transmembrane protein 131-like n=1 Tax=Tupaia chinensis TaxID=246437 RepID=UPI000FFB53DC|nr:transmembrane protein 131-like [Tupaia chinensis]